MGHPSDTVDGSETPANSPVEVGSWTPIIYNGLGYISGGCLGILNHQQYCWSSNDLLRIFVGGKIHIEYVQYINVYVYILMYLGGTPVIWNICESQIGITSPSRVETKSVKPPPIFRYLAILIFIITALAFQTATPCQDFQKASHKIKNGLTFHFTSWFRGIPILVYDNPHITGQYNLLYPPAKTNISNLTKRIQ